MGDEIIDKEGNLTSLGADTIIGSPAMTPLQAGQLQSMAAKPPEGYKLAYVPSDYTESPELAAAMQRSAGRQAGFGGAASLIGELAQIGLGRVATAESRAYSADRLADLEGTENFVSDAEKQQIQASMVEPAKQVAAESGLRAEKVLASDGLTSREYLGARELAVADTQEAGIAAGLKTVDLEESRRTAAEEEADELRHFLWQVDKETLWEPLAKFTGNIGEVIGEIVKYAPGRTYAAEIDEMRAAGVPDHIAARTINVTENLGQKGRRKVLDAVKKRYGNQTKTSIPGVAAKAPPTVTITEKEPATWKDPGDGRFEYTLEGNVIKYISPEGPRKGQTISVKPGDQYYDEIMATAPASGQSQ